MPATGSVVEPVYLIREEQPEDISGIRLVNELAFGQPQEANIIDALRLSCRDLLSLVALSDGQVVGHILFSRVVIRQQVGEIQGYGLGPLAVSPAYQRKGIGSQLVKTGLERLQRRSCPFVILLGHPDYYPRFGFQRASLYQVHSQWQGVPDEAFMIIVFDVGAMQNVAGIAYYRPEFDTAVTDE